MGSDYVPCFIPIIANIAIRGVVGLRHDILDVTRTAYGRAVVDCEALDRYYSFSLCPREDRPSKYIHARLMSLHGRIMFAYDLYHQRFEMHSRKSDERVPGSPGWIQALPF
jgi:hypothetical protein